MKTDLLWKTWNEDRPAHLEDAGMKTDLHIWKTWNEDRPAHLEDVERRPSCTSGRRGTKTDLHIWKTWNEDRPAHLEDVERRPTCTFGRRGTKTDSSAARVTPKQAVTLFVTGPPRHEPSRDVPGTSHVTGARHWSVTGASRRAELSHTRGAPRRPARRPGEVWSDDVRTVDGENLSGPPAPTLAHSACDSD